MLRVLVLSTMNLFRGMVFDVTVGEEDGADNSGMDPDCLCTPPDWPGRRARC
jgi:hypothetical protein